MSDPDTEVLAGVGIAAIACVILVILILAVIGLMTIIESPSKESIPVISADSYQNFKLTNCIFEENDLICDSNIQAINPL